MTKQQGNSVIREEWGDQLRRFRIDAGYFSQGALAEAISRLTTKISEDDLSSLEATFQGEVSALNISQTALSRWETSTRQPPRQRNRHLYLVWALAQLGSIQLPVQADSWLTTAGLKSLTAAERQQIWPFAPEAINEWASDEPSQRFESTQNVDWGNAPYLETLYGRDEEQAQIKEWLLGRQCRLVGIWGIGGQGKTSLAAYCGRSTAPHFDAVIWRSLLNAPPIDEVINEWLQFLTKNRLPAIPASLNKRILLLFELLQTQRCLLILDNLESILDVGDRSGHYRQGYESYGQLITRFGETRHQSVLLLTSREEPSEFIRLRSNPLYTKMRPAQSIALSGLDQTGGVKLLTNVGLQYSMQSAETLFEQYSGNPLALILISRSIVEFYGGDLDLFLEEDNLLFDNIQEVLAQQLARLSKLESLVLHWLAIERQPITAQALRANLLSKAAQENLMRALRSLRQRSLIEVRYDGPNAAPKFALQNVVTEYLTESIIQLACWDLLHLSSMHEKPESSEVDVPVVDTRLSLTVPSYSALAHHSESDTEPGYPRSFLHYHALIKATAASYIRQTQERLLLQPVAEQLVSTIGQSQLREKTVQRLDLLRQQGLPNGYTAGNILNLLLYLFDEELQGFDFSTLPVWQAVIKTREMKCLNFAHADLSHSLLYGNGGRIPCLAFHPNGQVLFAGSHIGILYTYNAHTLELLDKTPDLGQHVTALSISADGRILISADSNDMLHVWDILDPADGNQRPSRGSLRPRFTLTNASSTRSVVLCAENRVIAAACLNQIRLWDLHKQQPLIVLSRPVGIIDCLAYSSTYGILASDDADNRILLWQIVDIDGEVTVSTDNQDFPPFATLAHSSPVFSIAISPDGRWLAAAGDNGEIHLWELSKIVKDQSRSNSYSYAAHQVYSGHTHKVNTLTFSSDGEWLASGSRDGTIRVWAVSSGQTIQVFQHGQHEIVAMQFSPNADILATTTMNKNTILQLLEVKSGKKLKEAGAYTDNKVYELDFSPDQRQLISGDDSGNIYIWDAETERCGRKLCEHTNLIYSIVYSPDGQTFASSSLDQTICIWHSDKGKLLQKLLGHTGEVTSVAYHPQEKIVASGSNDRTIRLWNPETGQLLSTWTGSNDAIWSVAFSPDGKTLATGCTDGTIYLWDLVREKIIGKLEGHRDLVWTIAYSPDGKWIASAGYEGDICLWDAKSWENIGVNWKHEGRVRALRFSPDSKWLASTGDDQCIFLWDIHSGQRHQLDGRGPIAFARNGNLLATGGENNVIQLWDVITRKRVGYLEGEGAFHGTNITGIKGITSTQIQMLKLMGAIEEPSVPDNNFEG